MKTEGEEGRCWMDGCDASVEWWRGDKEEKESVKSSKSRRGRASQERGEREV